jgi:preprotein translocase SecE subunit
VCARRGAWLNWQSTGLQNRRLQVRVLSPLRKQLLFGEDLMAQTRTSSLAPVSPRGGGRRNPIRFYREVVAELRKVIWPTRKELITYTAVVIVFVSIMVAIVAGLDYGFARAVLAVFG